MATNILAFESPRTVRIATSFEQLDSWGDAYDGFLDKLGEYALFYRKGWLEALWPAYSLKPGELYFLSVWRGEEIVAMAPLQLLQKGPLQGWRRVLAFIGTFHPTLVNPWPEILVAPDAPREACISALLATLDERGDWDEIDLHHGPLDSPNRALLMRAWPD